MDLIVWITLGIFIVIVGLLIYFAWKENRNNPPKQEGPMKEKQWRNMLKK